MKGFIILFFLFTTVYGQDKDSAKAVIDVNKNEIEREIYRSNITNEKLDDNVIKALQDKKNEPEILIEMSAKTSLLQKENIQRKTDQNKGIYYNASRESEKRNVISLSAFAKIKSVIETQSESESIVKRLYGPSQFDSRIELLQLDIKIDWQAAIIKRSESVAMIVEKENLNQLAKETYVLDVSHTLGELYGLCSDEAFYKQPTSGIGTSFILTQNTMITANHVFDRPITDYAVVFGYKLLVANNSVADYYFNKNDIYFPKAFVKRDDELDVAEFMVDRDFDRPVLKWEKSKDIDSKNNEIYMIGHPSGLPIKIALNAGVEDNINPYFFYTSLDSFQGNSGSPVFNFYTHKVIGILVAGEVDYKFNGSCYYSPVCKIPYCKGEKVIRIEKVLEK